MKNMKFTLYFQKNIKYYQFLRYFAFSFNNRPQNILRLFKSIPSPLISMLKPTVLIQNEHKVTLKPQLCHWQLKLNI